MKRECDIEQLHQKLRLLLLAACVLTESMADTSRIVRNTLRMAVYMKLNPEHVHIEALYESVRICYCDHERSLSISRRCTGHHVDMWRIAALSHLSWRALRCGYCLELFEDELERIAHRPRIYGPWMVVLAGALACGGFCVMFGGDAAAFVFAVLAAFAGSASNMLLRRTECNAYIAVAASAMVATLSAWAITLLSAHGPGWMASATPWHPIMACALYLIPGIPLINCVSDFLDGYTRAGMVRCVNCMLVLLAMALGIALGIKICHVYTFVSDLKMVTDFNYFALAGAAALSAVGFSIIFNAPRRMLWVIALGGIVAVCVRNLVAFGPETGNVGLGGGTVVGSLIASTVVGLLAVALVHPLNSPHHCLSVPSVIPMVPGVLMYRSLFAFINMHGVLGEVTVAMHNGIMACLIVLCIALGVAIPNIFFRRMITTRTERRMLSEFEHQACEIDRD